MKNSISVFAPATIANLSCGYDVLGLALNGLGDTITVSASDTDKITVTVSTEGEGETVSTDPEKNSVSVAAKAVLEKLNIQSGLNIHLLKAMPLGSGLGSSASSSAGGAVATNKLFGSKLSQTDVVLCAMEGERVACGSAHADNVAPAIYGGIVLIRSYDPLDIIKLPVPSDFFCGIIRPHIEVRTEDARRILRKHITIKASISQTGNLGGFIAGLYNNDYELISRCLNDSIAEPERMDLIPFFKEARDCALNNGAIAYGISGSGPSMFMIGKSHDAIKDATTAAKNIFIKNGINATSYLSAVNTVGAVEV